MVKWSWKTDNLRIHKRVNGEGDFVASFGVNSTLVYMSVVSKF